MLTLRIINSLQRGETKALPNSTRALWKAPGSCCPPGTLAAHPSSAPQTSGADPNSHWETQPAGPGSDLGLDSFHGGRDFTQLFPHLLFPAWSGAPEAPEVFPGSTCGVSGPTGSIRGARPRLVPGRFTAPRYSGCEPDLNNLWAVKLSPVPGSTRGKQLLAAPEVQLSPVLLAGTCPVTCHGSFKATKQLRVHQQLMGLEEEPTARCAALKCWDLWQPLTQGIFSQDKSALTQSRMGSTKLALPWCSTHTVCDTVTARGCHKNRTNEAGKDFGDHRVQPVSTKPWH